MSLHVKRSVAALGAGAVFGVGLAISGMTNPPKILAFLNVLGNWDPSLILVMASALGVTAIGFRAFGDAPLLDTKFHLPSKTELDRRLLFGAAIFGVGWGLAGLCPGPAIASISGGEQYIYVFIAAMIAGGFLATSITRWLDNA